MPAVIVSYNWGVTSLPGGQVGGALAAAWGLFGVLLFFAPTPCLLAACLCWVAPSRRFLALLWRAYPGGGAVCVLVYVAVGLCVKACPPLDFHLPQSGYNPGFPNLEPYVFCGTPLGLGILALAWFVTRAHRSASGPTPAGQSGQQSPEDRPDLARPRPVSREGHHGGKPGCQS